MSGNLIPEKRADKRGNLVTRWVRMFGGSNDSAKDLPSPGMGVTKSSRKFSPEQQTALIDKFATGSKIDERLKENIKYIASKDPALLERISSAVHEGDDTDLDFWSRKMNGGHLLEFTTDPASRLKGLNESLVVFPLMRQIASGGGMDIDSNEPHDVIYTVRETMETSRIRNPSEETVAAVAAVVYATNAYVWRGEVTTPEYKDIRKDVEYVRDNIEDMGRILPELHRRNTLDRDVIATLLSSPTQALSEGEL
jgi:hypothetical protein